ncbi:hypothetical protein [Paenibacillus kobensis]|uniref:hypothetical protein n=1 Tax=Paenibacillus kobensis TaxID=59841 RepID=UPI000FD71BAC|nr:hypothetical protein [Paenibacillus kobensis]
MNSDLFNKINGYLEGLSTINTYFGNCYGHKYIFAEIVQPIEQAVTYYNKTGNLSRHHDIKYLPLVVVDDWKDSLFQRSADWFFSLYRMQNFQVEIGYHDGEGNELPLQPAEYDKSMNFVSNKLIELLEQFFEGRDVEVFLMNTHVEEKDEFDWEQFYFTVDNRVFVLEFYQWG